jgi:hypothetical protein
MISLHKVTVTCKFPELKKHLVLPEKKKPHTQERCNFYSQHGNDGN